MKYAIIDKDGNIKRIVTCQESDLVHNTPDGHKGIPFEYDTHDYYYNDGFIKIPDMPDRHYVWDTTNHVWTYNQELYDYWIKQDNKKLLNSNIVVSGYEYQADTKSLSAMMTQYQLLSIVGGVVKWKLADNSFVELSAEDLLEVIKAISARTQKIISA